jgi:ankyrin repeat protein
MAFGCTSILWFPDAEALIFGLRHGYHQGVALYPYNSDEGQTDLMAAAYNGDAEEVERLLTCPCDVDAQDAHGISALMYAAMAGYAEVVKTLLGSRPNLELQSRQGFTALTYAARDGHVDCVRALLRAGANPDVHESYDMADTPLILAAQGGHFEVVKALVAAGADPAIYGGAAGWTAECVARHHGHHEISDFLCYNGKRPES